MGNISKNKYASEWEEVKKRKKESADNSTPSNQNKYASEWEDVRKNMFLSSLPSRLESLTSSRNELSKNYNSRFFDKDGNYINSYRGDTKDALTSFETSRANVSKEYESLLSDLTKYEKYFDAEKVKTLKDYLTAYGSDMQSMYDTYKLDSNTYSRYADEDAYNRAKAYAKEQDEKVKKYSSMTDDELEAELKALEDSKKGNAFTNFAMKVIGAQQDIKSGTNLYAEGESNQAHNENVDYDIALIEKEKNNRKYKQIDELPGSVKALVDELTVIDSTNDDEEFANKMATILSGFTGGNNVNYNVGSGSERRGEIIRELESMGVKNWQELLDYNKLRYNEKKNAATKDEYAQMAKEHPVLSSLISIPASLGKGIGTLEMLENIGSDVPLDPNSPYFGMNDLSNAIRETVMDEHDFHLNTGNQAIDNIDINDEIYSLLMSTGDSVMAGLGGMGVKGLGGSVLGLSAASDAAQEVAERGGSSTEAITTGLVSGMNEMLWESLSLGKLDDLITNGVKKRGFVPFVKELLKSMGINASEELNTEAANLIADYVINGGASTYAETVQNYLSAGYTHDEAKKLANKDMLSQTAKAGVSGALQGLLMGVGGGALSTTANAIDSKSYENKFYNKMGSNVVENNNVSQLAEEAKSLGNSKLRKLANVAEAVNVGELDPKEAKKYVHQVGKLYKGVQKAQFDSLSKTSETAFRNVIKAELEKTGVADVDATTDILVKAMHNKGLTRAETKKLQSVDGRSILDKVLYSAEFNKTLDAEQKKQFTEGFDKFVNTESLAGRTLTDRKADLVSKAGYKLGAEKTFVDATDEVVDSLKVNSIKGDTITLDVKLGENNQVVAADELTFDNDYAVIISGLQSISKDFGLDVDSANRVLALWESYDGDSFDFYKTAQSGIMYGQYNQRKYFDNATFGNVPDNIRNELYNIGKEYRQKVTDTKAKAIKERSIPNGEVKVTFAEGVQYHKLTKSQKAQVDMAQIIARAFGFNLEVFRSPKVNGKSVGENGSFSPSANLMRLDIDAGTLDGKALILFTQGHELTHFIKAWSETAYKKFADFLIEKYTDKDVPLKSLVESKIENSKILAQSDKTGKHKELSYDEALEEVVCDACEDFLADPNIQQTILEIAKVDQSLADKIKNFIKNLINRLEKALRGLQGQSEAAGYTRSLDANDLQELKDLWTSALIDARENVLQAKARGGETQKNTTVEDDAKEQARFKGHTNIEKNGKKRYNKRSFYSSFDSLAMNWAYHPDTQVGDTNIFFRNNVAVLVEATENGFIEISSGKYEKVRSVYEQAHRETNRGLYANLSRIESRRGTDSWDLQYAEDGRYDVRDAQQNESQGFQTDSERDDEHLWSGDKREPVKRQDRDSLGRTLSETQQSYFADSKIRDKNGNLMVMYHGSPKDDISSFRLSLGGAYFTANYDYAREYARDVGKVYEVYLNITKPFDTRNAECRAIFEKKFYGQWGNGAPLGDKGLPDWTDGDDLIDFLQEKGYDYDGLLLDEGGVPVGNGVKDRGISYVVFDRANQVKYTDNLNPTTNEDMKFAMRENVEETKDLVAVHNLTEEKLLKSLKLGGLPMPSIAIIKAREGHNAFGNVSLVFGRDTIDPRLLKSNKVYSRDAYTPTYPRVEYKASYSVADKVENRIDELLSGTDYKTAFGYLGLDYGNIDDSLNRNGGDVYEAYGRKEAIKLAYLRDKGVELKLPKKEKPLSYRFDNDIIVKFAEKYGEEKVIELINSSSSDKIDSLIPEIKALVENYYSEIVGEDMDWQIARNDVWDFLDNAVKYFRKGIIKQTEDSPSTRQMIDDAIDENDYKNWVNELFSGIIEKEGLRNNKDLFTPSGNRRSFEALHDDVSLNNIIKAMKNKGEKGLAVLGGSITGASAIDFSSIEEIKSNSNKIKRVSEEEVDNARKEFRDRLSEIASTLPKHSEAYTSVVDLICEAVAKCKTKSGIANYIRKEGEGWIDYSDYAIDDVWELVNDIRNSPVAYFEAKPQRAVMFNEVKAVIVPDNSSQELREQLNSMGVNVLTYESGNDESRINALNSIEDVKFQDRVKPEQDAEYLELAKNPEKNEARLREMVDAVARANGYTIHSYHGTRDKSFTEFKKELIGSRFSFDDKGFFFIDRKSIADDYAHSDFDAKAYGRVLDVFLKVKKPLMVNKSFCLKEGLGNPFRDDDAIGVWDAYSEFFKEEAENRKVDGIILDDGMSKMTVVFDPNQIKSADLVTYDHNGNIIPLSERFNEVNKDIRYQDRDSAGRELTPEQVEFYKDSKVRDENGNLLVCYHGTDVEFDTFDADFISQDNKLGLGFYFKMGEGLQYSYEHPKTVYLNIENPVTDTSKILLKEALTEFCEKTGIELDYDSSDYDLDVYQRLSYSYRGRFKEFLDDVVNILGVDGIISKDRKTAVAFKSNQIKDIDNLTPTESDDIHYQDRPYQPSLEVLGIDYKAENDKLKADVDRLNKLLKLQRTLTHGALFTKTSVDKAASLIMKEFGLHRGKSDLSEKLNALYTFVASSNDLTWDEFYDRASQVANWMIDSKPDQRYYKNPYASEVLKNIRERGITLNEKQKEEAAYYTGSLNAYRKSNIGNFRIVNEGGISLTELWEQLVEDYPGAFSQEDIEKGKKDTNLPSLIVEVIGTMRQTESVLEQMDRTQEVRKMVEKIYDTYWNVTTLHTLADKHQKEVNLLKGKHRAEMDALKEKGDENLKQAKERYREMLQKVREDKDAKMTAYKEHVAEQRHKSVEGRNKTATKNKIKRVVQALASLYNNPTKERNVKVEFQDMVDKALVMADAIFDNGNISVYDILSSDIPNLRESERKDLEKWRENQKLKADYQRELDELEASEKLDQATHDRLLKNISECNRKLNYYSGKLKEVIEVQRGNLNDHAIQNAIDSLVSAYKSLNESTEGYAKAAYNEYVDKRLVALKEALKNTTIKTMTQTQLDELYQAYKMVLTTVRTANELFIKNKKMTVADAGEAVMREVKSVAKVTENKVLAKQNLNKFMWEELKPVYAFERIGSETFMNLYKEILRGQSVFGRDVAETQDFFQRKSKAYNYDSWDFDERRDFKLADGRTFTISLQEIMSIYAYSKREQALDHIAKGGFVFDSNEFFTDTKEKGIKGKIKKVRTTVEAYRLNDETFYKVINSLTPEQKKFVDDMQDYLSTVMGAKGNEVSRVLYGIDLFREKHYFPLMSSHDFIQQTNNPAGEVALRNSGMAKATVPHARNPIILKGFMDVWSEHTNKMSTYHAFVLPIENLNKVFNYTGYATDNKSVSVQTILNGAYGPAVNRYITTLLQDLNGGIKVQGSGNWVTKGISLFKKTAVAASTSVVVQQPTAIVRALAMIDGKYFIHGKDGLKHNEAWDKIKKHAPIAVIKEMGGFDVGGGKQVGEYITAKSYKGKDKIKGFFTDSKYRDDALMWGASKMDEVGWVIIWNAVEQEIADTTTYKVGSEEFLQACGERFTEVIDYTQVYDSVLSRSGFMRNKGEISKMATSFMGEPTTSFNMLCNAVLQLKRGNISKLGATKIVGATMASIIFAAIAKSLIYALRDDDEDESYVEKYAQALTDSLKSDLFIPNMLPYVSDITSLLSGWDVERTDMAILKDLKDAVDGLDSSSKSPYRKVEDLAGAIAAFGGIPLKNVMRTTREMYNAVANIFDGNTADIDDVGDAVVESFVGDTTTADVNKALEKGNTAKAKETINELVADKVESGKTEKEAKASIKASVTSYWKDLYLQAYRDKDNAEMLRIRRILQATGLYDDVLTTCSNWIKSLKDEPTETKFKKQ